MKTSNDFDCARGYKEWEHQFCSQHVTVQFKNQQEKDAHMKTHNKPACCHDMGICSCEEENMKTNTQEKLVTSQHTPTPYRKRPFLWLNEDEHAAQAKCGCYLTSALDNGGAAFIRCVNCKRAVNSHNILLDAVKFAYKLAKIDYEDSLEKHAPRMVIDGTFEEMKTFRDAIAQAEGK